MEAEELQKKIDTWEYQNFKHGYCRRNKGTAPRCGFERFQKWQELLKEFNGRQNLNVDDDSENPA